MKGRALKPAVPPFLDAFLWHPSRGCNVASKTGNRTPGYNPFPTRLTGFWAPCGHPESLSAGEDSSLEDVLPRGAPRFIAFFGSGAYQTVIKCVEGSL